MATSQKQIARRVAVLLEGSRGDCQPYMVGALALQNAGYDVTVFGTTDCEAMAKLLGGTPGGWPGGTPGDDGDSFGEKSAWRQSFMVKNERPTAESPTE